MSVTDFSGCHASAVCARAADIDVSKLKMTLLQIAPPNMYLNKLQNILLPENYVYILFLDREFGYPAYDLS